MTTRRKGFVEARLADLAPIRFLRGLWDGVAQVMGAAQDEETATLKAAASMRSPSHAPDDILPLLAFNFKIPLWGVEDPSRLRARIAAAFPTWEEAGLPQAIIRSLTAYGLELVQVFNYADWPTPDEWFSKFYVVGSGTMPWGEQTWGEWNWGEQTWGTTAEPDDIRQTLGQIVFWKSPQSLPVAFINNFGTGMVWGLHVWGEQTWGGATVLWPLANLWGANWVKWGAFKWGNGRWITGEVAL